MAEQEQHRSTRREGDPDEPVEPPAPPASAQAATDDVDALLDEIDDVLESNAETFVRGFVQKGGQ
ncbi:MAG: ubiquitin-like protein Pup [Micrococcales bacterium]|nr:MAG: ubiquitin-like protein Pup [Micrococcales bacterium]